MQKKKIHSGPMIKIFNKDRLRVTDFSFASSFNVAQLGTDLDNNHSEDRVLSPPVSLP